MIELPCLSRLRVVICASTVTFSLVIKRVDSTSVVTLIDIYSKVVLIMTSSEKLLSVIILG